MDRPRTTCSHRAILACIAALACNKRRRLRNFKRLAASFYWRRCRRLARTRPTWQGVARRWARIGSSCRPRMRWPSRWTSRDMLAFGGPSPWSASRFPSRPLTATVERRLRRRGYRTLPRCQPPWLERCALSGARDSRDSLNCTTFLLCSHPPVHPPPPTPVCACDCACT
ncbi:hypothetical protein B0T22DRAFT_256676 [Podospora appendiculata]|uniref:Uncharacterized protein n=1 Tax=Podospora appendiculata TaxID=314037 RepID=A0AAE1C938_9PEZI|nr:hypothetical protein B0T22DRAFT_256676 [Podospora appendiculata]